MSDDIQEQLRKVAECLRERADSLERELSLLADRAEERAEWARTEERTRIAREMHDVVAHRVSLMVVHAAALQAVAPKDPAKAVRNAALVGDMGRQALTELREMLGVLRTGDALTAPTAATAASEDGPRLHELEALVAQSRQAGMTVEPRPPTPWPGPCAPSGSAPRARTSPPPAPRGSPAPA